MVHRAPRRRNDPLQRRLDLGQVLAATSLGLMRKESLDHGAGARPGVPVARGGERMGELAGPGRENE
eukprot:4012293-Pyramimonas_sp.AAC.1